MQDSDQPGREVLSVLLPALYLSRIAAEFVIPSAGAIAALAGLLVGGGAVAWLRKRSSSPGWFSLLLLPYVGFPYQSPPLALACGLLFAVAWGAERWHYQGWPIDIGVFSIALIFYGLTLAPGVQPADAGEFQLVLAEWGVAHPPGYPLYTMLGGLFTHLFPLGDLAGRANLFSALTGALTLAVLARAIRLETGSGWAGMLGAGVLGVAASFWATATQASIRPLTALFAALMIEAALAYRRAVRTADEPQVRRAIIRFGLAAGFGVTHHASLFFPGVVLALAILAARPRPSRRQIGLWSAAALAALFGALPWLYLLLRGLAGAPLAPPNLATWEGLRQHVLAAGFAGDMFYYHTPPEIIDRLRLTAQVLAFQWEDLTLALGIAALGLMVWRDRWLALALGGSFALHTFVAATYRAPQTVEYMIPAYVSLAVGIGWAVGETRRWSASRRLHPWLAAGTAIAIVWSGWPTWISLHAYQDRDRASADARALLESAPLASIVLANWHQVTPLMFWQEVEQLRPDVDVRYVAPAGAEPIVDTWTRRVRAESGGQPLIACVYYPETYRYTGLTFSALQTCWQTSGLPAPPTASGPVARLGSLSLYDAALPAAAAAGERVYVWLDWQLPGAASYGDLTTFVHLVDDAGHVLAQSDQPLIAAGLEGPGMVSQRYTLAISRTVSPGIYRLFAGAYRPSPDGPIPLHDEAGAARRAIGELAIHPADLPPVTSHEWHAPLDDRIVLVGYDYDLSVVGRARLYLHWRIATPVDPDLRLAINGPGPRPLAESWLPLSQPGYVTTAHDLPDTETVGGLWLTASVGDDMLWMRGAWGLPLMPGIALPGPAGGDRYIMVGDVVVTGYAVRGASVPGEETQVSLTLRCTTALTQDMSVQLALGSIARSDSTPVGGTIPTLKWGWGATITDEITVPWPADQPLPPGPLTLTFYDAFTGDIWPVFDPVLSQDGPGLRLTP